MNKITNNLIHKGYLKSDLIIEAFAEIPRAEFVPSRLRGAAEFDIPIPVGHGFMIPAMSVVAFMLELLAVERGKRVLVVGHGSGWTSALLSYIVGKDGHVTSVGRSEELRKQALTQMAKFSFIERDHIVDTYVAHSCDQLDFDKKYDYIIVMDEFFMRCELSQLLNHAGTMVAPMQNVITLFRKEENSAELSREPFAGMTFLPLDL